MFNGRLRKSTRLSSPRLALPVPTQCSSLIASSPSPLQTKCSTLDRAPRPLLLLLFAVFAIGGCSKPVELFPLKVGNEWRYLVKGQLGQFLHEVRVTREYPVQSGQGFELTGSLGDSVLAWDGNILKASVLAGTRFNPPIAILDGSKKEAKMPWKGRMYLAGKTLSGGGSVDQHAGVWPADQRVKAIQTDMVLQLGEKTLKVTTIYVRGKGPVLQKQWTVDGINETYDFGFEWLGGP